MDEPLREISRYGFNETILNPYALVFMAVMCILVYCASRKYAILPVAAVSCFMTSWQRIVIGGIDFDMIRIILFVGFIRIIIRSEYRTTKLNTIDKILVIYVFCGIITYTLLWGSGSALTNRLGWAYTILGSYFFCRICIKSLEDIKILIIGLLFINIITVISMVSEQITQHNFFHILGGVPEFSFLRDGRVRSQAAFGHPILAGCFGAFMIPMVIGLSSFIKKRGTFYLWTGFIVFTTMVITSSSSGPLVAYMAGLFGMLLWFLRKQVKLLCIAFIGMVIGLQLCMNAPIWFLIARVSIVGGSTAYFRAALINAAITRINEWWLLGIRSTGHWGWGFQDVCVQYIRIGVDGGLLGLILFITIMVLCFKTILKITHKTEKIPNIQKFIWSIGAALFSHTIGFLGVSYFGQMLFFWYMTLAIISSLNNMPFRIIMQKYS